MWGKHSNLFTQWNYTLLTVKVHLDLEKVLKH